MNSYTTANTFGAPSAFRPTPAPVLHYGGEITVASVGPPTVVPVAVPVEPQKQPTTTAIVPTRTAVVYRQPRSTPTDTRKPEPRIVSIKKTTITVYKDPVVSKKSQAPPKTYPPEIAKMKKRRKGTTVAFGIAGGIVGVAAMGPIGGIVGGVGAAFATRAVGKKQEKKRKDEIAQRDIAEQERNAPEVAVHKGALI